VPASAAASTKGVLVADNLRLDELLAELARYRPGLLRCDAAVAGLTVNGVFSLRDTDRALRNLALALPVQIVARTRYWSRCKPPPAAA
jgi:transmembrane sensor